MLEVQKRLFDTAIKQLTMLGVKYAVQLPDGTTMGELEIKPVKPPKVAGKPRKNFRQYGYITRIEAMKVGDVEVFDVPEGFTPQEVQGNVTGTANRFFGPGNYTSAQVGNTVQLMRTA